MNQINLQNRLAVSNGTVKNGQNNAMQPASPTTESPETAKKRLHLLASLAIGVDAAASFLKTKMEKAAAVVSQVGAAVLQSKKTISAAADAVIGAVQPKSQKIAVNHLAKGKARLAVSAPILALLAGIFAVQPQAMAQLNITGPLPYYDKKVHYNVQAVRSIPFIVDLADYYNEVWTLSERFNSEVFSPAFREEWGMFGVAYYCRHNGESKWEAGFYETTWYTSGVGICVRYWKDKNGQAQQRPARLEVRNLVNHSQVGKKITTETTTRTFTGRLELVRVRTTEEWKCPFYSSPSRPPSPGDIIYHGRSFFLARLEGSTKPDGSCESFGITDPGYETIHYPCVPNNMSMPTNGVIIYSLYNVMRNRITVHDDE